MPASSTFRGLDLVIVPLSGGLDSTGIVVDALRGAASVSVLAIELRTTVGRSDVELVCREEIITALQLRHRNLTVHRISMDVRSLVDFDDSTFWLYATGVLLRQYRHGEAAVAWGLNEVGHESLATEAWSGGSYMKRSIAKLSAGFGDDATPFVINPPPHLTWTKTEVAALIGEELLAKTWSCRRPDYRGDVIEPCLKCHACRRRRELGIPHRTVEVAHVLRARNHA